MSISVENFQDVNFSFTLLSTLRESYRGLNFHYDNLRNSYVYKKTRQTFCSHGYTQTWEVPLTVNRTYRLMEFIQPNSNLRERTHLRVRVEWQHIKFKKSKSELLSERIVRRSGGH